MSADTPDSNATPTLGRFAAAADSVDCAIPVNDYIYRSKDMGCSNLIVTDAGDAVVNSGFPGTGKRHKARFAQISRNPIEYLVLTQCHVNQFGGAMELKDPQTRIIAQARYREGREYWIDLNDFYTRRANRLWGTVLGERANVKDKIQEVSPDIVFDDHHHFELGGRRFDLYAVPGGESLEALIVFLPQDRIAFIGNLVGPIFGHLPNLYTIRGDKIRSAKRYVESVRRLLALQPEMVITGHEVVSGAERIRSELTRACDAVLYIYERTIAGMNAGKDVHALMREICLPEALQVGQGHGKVAWCVRAIWEEYAGWFHYDATTSLYGVPCTSVAGDVVELAGGANRIAARAQARLERSEPLQALHLVETALAADPANRAALQVKLDAHRLLLEQSGGENFSEVMWLKGEIAATQQLLDGTARTTP